MNREDIIQYLQREKKHFAREFGVRRIGLFGSFSRGANTELSDLDIVVELEHPDLYSLIGLKQVIEEQLGLKVDIVRLRKRMNNLLRKRIDRDAIYV